MTHDDLVILAYRWLLRHHRCAVAVAEVVTSSSYSPDAIGWRNSWNMVDVLVVEVKVSRSDYRADASKVAHQTGCIPGKRRWYCTPKGLILPSELREGWGLVEVHEHASGDPEKRRLVTKVDAPQVAGHRDEEMRIASSIMRRLADGGTIDQATGRLSTWDATKKLLEAKRKL
ncbi:hypothetical protein UFOVP1382_104 [uncultured Caudovirales phage]|uniref:Uncharacterized protein n=1 Tax=uncultured Caudovirales phage TaxID=2100421 RepID=A0A6J5S3D9_9CAUD|nr:hypothetical protein UFOVP1382_104 [uncultured Caudovirales phage]